MSQETSYAPHVILKLHKVRVEKGLIPTEGILPENQIACIEFRQSTNTDNFRLEFRIENNGFFYPNFGFMNLTIHNANASGILGETNVPISNGVADFLIGVELQAGYESGGSPITIFRGLATEIIDAYIQPNDQLQMYCTFCPNSTSAMFSFKPQTTFIQAINEVLETFSFNGDSPVPFIESSSIHPMGYGDTPLFLAQPLSPRKPLPVSGSLSKCLFTIANAWHSRINLSSVGVGAVRIGNHEPIALPSYLSPGTTIVNYTSGLIGSPSYFWNSSQVSFQTVLNPNFDFRTLFLLQNLGGSIQGPTGTALNIDNSRIRDTLGFPKIVVHKGDTRGNDWYTEVTGIVFPSIYNIPGQPDVNLPGIISCIGQ